MEAPFSIGSTVTTKGLDSAGIELVIMRWKIDACTGAGDRGRRLPRRGNARGTDPAYEGVTFGAGRRWVSR